MPDDRESITKLKTKSLCIKAGEIPGELLDEDTGEEVKDYFLLLEWIPARFKKDKGLHKFIGVILGLIFMGLFAGVALGQDAKITALPANGTPAGEDLVACVDDPAGTPVTRKCTLTNIFGQLDIPIILDLADDASNESTGISEIATSGDTNSIFTEPIADKLLIDLTANWPSADTADALSANGANCLTGEIALGVDAAGAVEGCYEPSEADISDLNHTATSITDGLIVEADLNEDSGTPTDEDVLTYDITGANFNWVAQSTLAAGTAASLAANGTNCSAGEVNLGVDAAGNAEGCATDDDVPESGDFGNANDLDAAGDVADNSHNHGSSTITDNDLLEADLKVVDTPSDEECLTYEATGGDFEWQSCGAVAGGSTTEVQYNNAGSLGGISQFTYDGTNVALDLVAGDSLEATRTAVEVYNNSGGTIYECSAVYISGYNVGAALPEVDVADADNSSAMPALGLLETDIANGASGFAIVSGTIGSLDTSVTESWAVGAPVYVNTSGTSGSADCASTLTETKPSGATTGIQSIARVVRVNASTGILVVQGAGRSNAVPNLTSAKYWLGNGSGVATEVSMSGDATMDNTGAVTIANNAIEEAMLNAVAGPTDEYCLTYEADTTNFAWQVCSAGSGDITDVFDCASGDCNTPVIGTGERLDGGTATVDGANEGILAPRGTSCAAATTEGQICWDTDDDALYIGDGVAASAVGGGSDTNAVKEYNWTAAALLALEHSADSIAPILKEEGTNVDLLIRAFDDTTDECAGGTFLVPSDVTSGSTITFRVRWYSGTATTGNIIWDFRHLPRTEGESWDAALTTETASADATQGTVDQITVTTWTETLANTGWAASDLVEFEVCRDANNGSDTLSGDAYMIDFGVEIPRS